MTKESTNDNDENDNGDDSHHQPQKDVEGEPRNTKSLDQSVKEEQEQQDSESSSNKLPPSKHWKRVVNKIIDSNAAITFMSFVTTYALYGDDLRIIVFDPGADTAFLVLSSLAFAFFLAEITLLCWCRDKYLRRPDLAAMRELCTHDRWRGRKSTWTWLGQLGKAASTGSFYFWLDLISTFSMAIEMPWDFGSEDGAVGDSIDGTVAGKASLAGARAANKLKVIRMVRLVRLAKLYKYISAKQSAKSNSSSNNNTAAHNAEGGLDIFPAESHVGAEMSDRTTKKVIVGILIMLLGIPLLQADEVDYLNGFSMKMAFEHRKLLADGIQENEFEQWEFSQSLLIERTDCIDITYSGFNDGQSNDAFIPGGTSRIQDLRVEELDVFTISDADYVRSMTAVFDASERVREEAVLGILLTSFVTVLLGLGMLSFSKDVRNLVIVPIEHMIQLVREISENPLGNNLSLTLDDKHKDDGMETTLLIRTIMKIAGLMRVGFGEAGADIIGKNLNITQGTDTINLLGNGRKIHSIFGFCDVRQFTDTTECLQEEVMLFVNRIAHILHSIVVQCDGAANKNIGDAFLLTWKVKSDKPVRGSCEEHNYVADKALYSFIKTMIEMTRHEDFLCKFSPRALSELYERMPGYKCRIGCGLHFGWAIEGAIGSSKKIDASYISPHVNMSETLEGATKEYGTSILMSEPFYNLLSEEAMSGCRKVDMIKNKESDQGTGLYTYDVDLSVGYSLRSDKKDKSKNRLPHHRKTNFSLVARESGTPKSVKKVVSCRDWSFDQVMSTSLLINSHSCPLLATQDSSAKGEDAGSLGDLPTLRVLGDFPHVWMLDNDVVRARSNFSQAQRHAWRLGMNAFEEGKWDVAKSHFDDVTRQSDGNDGPSRYLLGRMKEYNYQAPSSWEGYWEN